MNRRLYRCRHDRRLAGVAAGVAEYFDLDPTLVRVLWFLSVFFGGFGLLLYIGLAIIVPLEPLPTGATYTSGAAAADPTGNDPTAAGSAAAEGAMAGTVVAPHEHRHVARGSGRTAMFVGIFLIVVGAVALVDVLVPGWAHSWRLLWPALLIAIGGIFLVGAVRHEPTRE